jgi:AraC-like DNA-binding protein
MVTVSSAFSANDDIGCLSRESRFNDFRRPDIEAVDPPIPLVLGDGSASGFFQALLVLKGAVRSEYEGGKATLLAGSLLLAPPGSRLSIREGTGAIVKSFFFGPSLVDAFISESTVDRVVETLACDAPCFTRLEGVDLEEASAVFAFLERAAAEEQPGYLPIIRLKVMELVLLLVRERDLGASPDKAAHFKAEDLERYIEEHYTEPLSLDKFATRFGLNPAYLSRAYRMQSGRTIVEYVNQIRIQKSCLLLKRSEVSILDIALSVGYNSLSLFNRNFRRILGMSPREYRNRSAK